MKTDDQLCQDVVAELRLNPLVGAAQIYVSVNEGVVELSGRVGSVQERVEAERTAYAVSGTKHVSLSIGIVSAAAIVRSDIEMARSAEEASRWSNLPAERADAQIKYDWDSSES